MIRLLIVLTCMAENGAACNHSVQATRSWYSPVFGQSILYSRREPSKRRQAVRFGDWPQSAVWSLRSMAISDMDGAVSLGSLAPGSPSEHPNFSVQDTGI